VDSIVQDMSTKFNLRSQDFKRMIKDAALGMTSYQALFREMRIEDQKRILRKMSPDERARYLPYAKHQVLAEFEDEAASEATE